MAQEFDPLEAKGQGNAYDRLFDERIGALNTKAKSTEAPRAPDDESDKSAKAVGWLVVVVVFIAIKIFSAASKSSRNDTKPPDVPKFDAKFLADQQQQNRILMENLRRQREQLGQNRLPPHLNPDVQRQIEELQRLQGLAPLPGERNPLGPAPRPGRPELDNPDLEVPNPRIPR